MALSNHWRRVRKTGATLCVVLACLLPTTAQAQAPAFLVQDINTQPAIFSSDPHDFRTLGATILFVAWTLETGTELWQTDGTAAGTVLVEDINPGAASSNPSWGFPECTTTPISPSTRCRWLAEGRNLFFTADDGTHGVELWKTDGSTAGTVLVKDINPGAQGSDPSLFMKVDGTLFLLANDGTTGMELWATDGSGAGTVLLRDHTPGAGSSSLSALGGVNGVLLFNYPTYPATFGRELWKSNGTAAGTVFVRDMTGDAVLVAVLDGVLIFQAYDYETMSSTLWGSDGTAAGTVLLKNVVDITTEWTEVDGTLFFRAYDPAIGSELWRSDGTVAGTVLVKDIHPGFESTPEPTLTSWSGNAGPGNLQTSDLVPSSSNPSGLTNVDGVLFFFADDGAIGLWKSDGSAAGTVLVKHFNIEIIAGTTDPLPYPLHNPKNVDGTLFFFVNPDDTRTSLELWKSDGTAAGTGLVKDIFAGYGPSTTLITALGGKLIFRTSDYTGKLSLWSSDGTEAGTVLLRDRICLHSVCVDPGLVEFFAVDGILFFAARDTSTGLELWKTDGTVTGTGLVKDIFSGPGSPGVSPLVNVTANGALLFVADDGTHGRELWRSDGTAAGTVLVRDLTPLGDWTVGSFPAALTDLNGTLFFTASDGVSGAELWKSDGTAAGTVLVKDISPGGGGSAPESLANLNGTLFFTAGDDTTGRELWKSNGTVADTVLVKDINPGTGSSQPTALTTAGGHLFFFADDGTTGVELWKSDGSAGGTALVKDICPGQCGQVFCFELSVCPRTRIADVGGMLFFTGRDSFQIGLLKSDGAESGTVFISTEVFPDPSSLTPVGDTLFFANIFDGSLWKSDGTEAGTVLVKGISVISVLGFSLTDVNGTLFFTAYDAASGSELWKSDGTEGGTVLVKDINPGRDSSNPTALTNVNGWLVFQACEPESGCEVWKSDGTADGTQQIADVVPGPTSSGPSDFTPAGPFIHFTAEELLHGRELWAIPVSALGQLPPCTGDCDGNEMVAINELVLGVNIALDLKPLNACPVFANSEGRVDIAQLVKGVNNALRECGG